VILPFTKPLMTELEFEARAEFPTQRFRNPISGIFARILDVHRNELIRRKDVPQVQLNMPFNLCLRFEIIAEPQIDRMVGWPVVGMIQIEAIVSGEYTWAVINDETTTHDLAHSTRPVTKETSLSPLALALRILSQLPFHFEDKGRVQGITTEAFAINCESSGKGGIHLQSKHNFFRASRAFKCGRRQSSLNQVAI
jgi:hypothetical protein